MKDAITYVKNTMIKLSEHIYFGSVRNANRKEKEEKSKLM